MATNFGTKIAINWLCVDDSDYWLGNWLWRRFQWSSTECRYCRFPAPKGRCHGNPFLPFDGL